MSSSKSLHEALGLRARRHIQTRNDIVAAAFSLFADKGFANVTMAEIAEAAGVSRSTAYRRFPTKEDVVLEVPKRWLDAFDAAAEQLPDDCSVADAFRITAEAVSTHIDDNLEQVMRAYAVLEQAPTLKVSGVATTAWLQRMVTLATTYGTFDDETAAVLAGAYLGGIDAMMFSWVAAGGTESVLAATKRLHQTLSPLFS